MNLAERIAMAGLLIGGCGLAIYTIGIIPSVAASVPFIIEVGTDAGYLSIGLLLIAWNVYEYNSFKKEQNDGHLHSYGVQGDLGWVSEMVERDFQSTVRKHNMDRKWLEREK